LCSMLDSLSDVEISEPPRRSLAVLISRRL
jgi:hypothetical protein